MIAPIAHPFSLAYLTVPGVTPPEQSQIAAQAGYDYVSFRLIHLGVPGERDIDPIARPVVRETRSVLDATGLECFDIELVRITRSLDPRHILPAFEAGAELGAKHVICSAWTDVRNDRNFIVDQFSHICALAEPFGLTVNLEFPAFSRLTTLKETVEILDLARAPNQGVLVDTLYMHFNKAPLHTLERVPSEWINFIHLCDAGPVAYTKDSMIRTARDARLYPGEGAIDFSPLSHMFPGLPLAIELPNEARSKALGHREHARRCLESARAIFNPSLHAHQV